jgi:integrase/recombinase XerD
MTTTAIIPQRQDFDAIVKLAIDGLGSESSKRRYTIALDRFLAWYAGNGHRTLTKSAVQSYKAHLLDLGLAPSTVNLNLSAIRRMATEAADNGLLDEHTAAAVRRVSNVRNETIPAGREVAPGEIAGLMGACAKDPSAAGVRDAALVGVLYVTGARRSEVAALELGDYDADTGALTIRHGKGNKQRVVYVTNGAKQALDDWLTVRGADPGPLFVAINKGGRILAHGITGQAIARILRKRADQAGVDEMTPHDLRRTMVGDMLDAGADLATVQKVCGHASPTTTARYDRRPEEAKRKAAGLLHVPYFGRV